MILKLILYVYILGRWDCILIIIILWVIVNKEVIDYNKNKLRLKLFIMMVNL